VDESTFHFQWERLPATSTQCNTDPCQPHPPNATLRNTGPPPSQLSLCAETLKHQAPCSLRTSRREDCSSASTKTRLTQRLSTPNQLFDNSSTSLPPRKNDRCHTGGHPASAAATQAGTLPPPQNITTQAGTLPPPQNITTQAGTLPPPQNITTQAGTPPPRPLMREHYLGGMKAPVTAASVQFRDLYCWHSGGQQYLAVLVLSDEDALRGQMFMTNVKLVVTWFKMCGTNHPIISYHRKPLLSFL